VFHARQHLSHGRTIAFELIRDEHPWGVLAPFQELAKASLRRLLIAPAWHEDIEDSPVLSHRPPEIVSWLSDGQNDCVEMPCITRPRSTALSLVGIGLAKRATPCSHGLI
jgi:hypothetical protein